MSGQHKAVVFLLIFLGDDIGSMLRHAVNQGSVRLFGLHFPTGTLIVNIVGSFAMGALVGLFAWRSTSQSMRLFLTTGVIGGFTTFFGFSLDAVRLFERKQPLPALAYVAGNIFGGLFDVVVGWIDERVHANRVALHQGVPKCAVDHEASTSRS